MPATDVTWSLNQPVSPVFQAFRTKRKNEFYPANAQCDMAEGHAKRQCIQSLGIQAGPRWINHSVGTRQQTSMESVEQMTVDMEPVSHPQPAIDMRVPAFPSQLNNNNNSGWQQEENNNNNTQIYNQGEMIMDLMDECYSTATLPDCPPPSTVQPAQTLTDAEYEAACYMMSTMDGEGAPDPYQYNISHNMSCSGDASATSGTLSRQGRSSLDSDRETYISDYY